MNEFSIATGIKINIIIMKTEHDLPQDSALNKTIVSKSVFLNGRAQKDFWEWYLKDNTLNKNKLSAMFKFSNANVIKVNFLAMPKTCQNALIIDWFDNVGIFIADWGASIIDSNVGFDSQIMKQGKIINCMEDVVYTRIEAINLAILKANVIYNESVI